MLIYRTEWVWVVATRTTRNCLLSMGFVSDGIKKLVRCKSLLQHQSTPWTMFIASNILRSQCVQCWKAVTNENWWPHYVWCSYIYWRWQRSQSVFWSCPTTWDNSIKEPVRVGATLEHTATLDCDNLTQYHTNVEDLDGRPRIFPICSFTIGFVHNRIFAYKFLALKKIGETILFNEFLTFVLFVDYADVFELLL